MQNINTYDLKLFTNKLKQNTRIDFTEYAQAIMRRRLEIFLKRWNIPDIESLIIKLKDNLTLLDKLIEHLSIDTTEMFRDPGFWRFFNKEIVLKLTNNDKINILVPYITSDDELYTLLIILQENNLLDKSYILATSPFEINLLRTQSGIYTKRKLELAIENYKRYKQDEKADISIYFNINFYDIQFSTKLINYVKFKKSDFIVNHLENTETFNLILFRNRMIYFNLNLQNKILEILYYHLAKSGYLMIGYKENINNFVLYDKFSQINKKEKVYIKKS